MKNKKAEGSTFLASETVKIVLSVISIILLIMLAAAIYNMLIDKTKLEQARATFDQIEGISENLEEGEEAKYLVTSPKSWFIGIYPKGEASPVACRGQDCICICDGEFKKTVNPHDLMRNSFQEKRINQCEDKGVCRIQEHSVLMNDINFANNALNYIGIYGIMNILIKREDGSIIFSTKNQIEFEDLELFENFLSSKSNFLQNGEITIQEQIELYGKTLKRKRVLGFLDVYYEGDKDMKEELMKNIENYFQNYDFPMTTILKVEGSLAKSVFYVNSGQTRELKEGELIPSWPTYLIEIPNPDVNKLIVLFQWQR
jgi:hypothetical protein